MQLIEIFKAVSALTVLFSVSLLLSCDSIMGGDFAYVSTPGDGTTHYLIVHSWNGTHNPFEYYVVDDSTETTAHYLGGTLSRCNRKQAQALLTYWYTGNDSLSRNIDVSMELDLNNRFCHEEFKILRASCANRETAVIYHSACESIFPRKGNFRKIDRKNVKGYLKFREETAKRMESEAKSNETAYLTWWKRNLGQSNYGKFTTCSVKEQILTSQKLETADYISPEIAGMHFEDAFELFTTKDNQKVVLIVPQDTLKSIPYDPASESDQYMEERWKRMEKCQDDSSQLMIIPSRLSASVPYNPYCTEYPQDLEISLIYIEDVHLPYIEIVTNGPACIPVYLYKYDDKEKRYVLLAEKCIA